MQKYTLLLLNCGYHPAGVSDGLGVLDDALCVGE